MEVTGNIAVFWTIRTVQDSSAHNWVAQELTQGRLRQGWGVEGLQLVEGSFPVSKSTWVGRYLKAAARAWSGVPNEDEAEKRFNILKRMLHLSVGDLLVVPQMPDTGVFTLALVSSPYYFDHDLGYSSYPWNPKDVDFGHVIGVDLAKSVILPCNTSSDSIYVTSRFSKYRSAVNIVRNPTYQAAVMRLFEKHVS
jgi:hypothetical protein